ncbi:sugar phosphate isomerase/epimerase family protein [Larkinella soli]|uniref:sugar phosphate isomerase/epimerase family protein n=1 Tax=Larkinella soli TaxID=1770527 RepID=UPI000FFBA56D|nr:sugar phosphate isomerase/epimerase [Larkinella soli]
MLNRRSFLAAAGAFALTDALSFQNHKPVVGMHVWVYSSDKPGFDCFPVLDQVFADVKYAGIGAVELMDVNLRHDDAVERIGEISRKQGVPVIGASYSQPMWDKSRQPEILDDAAKVVERLGKLGGRTLGISVGSAPKKKTPEQFDAQADTLKRIQAICQQNRVVPNLHNHTYEVADDLYDLQNTLQRVPDIALGPDLDWLFQAKVDVLTFLEKYGEKIVYLHLRDHRWTGTWSEALGEGITDFGAIARQLKKIRFAGDLTVELAFPGGFKPTRPLRESLKMSREVIRQKFGI